MSPEGGNASELSGTTSASDLTFNMGFVMSRIFFERSVGFTSSAFGFGTEVGIRLNGVIVATTVLAVVSVVFVSVFFNGMIIQLFGAGIYEFL